MKGPISSAHSRLRAASLKALFGSRPPRTSIAHNSRRRWGGSLLALVACLAPTGCASDSVAARGSLLIPYVLGNQLRCDDPNVKVARVRAILNDKVYEQESTCASPGEIRFEGVDAGHWQLTVEALDARGVIVMDNRGEEELPVVEVLGDGNVTTAAAVDLASVPAHLFLRWSEGFSDCDGLGIDRFAINVWDTSGTTTLMHTEISCATRPNAPEDYRRVPDPERRIHGGTMQSLSVQALKSDGVPVGKTVSFKLPHPPGAGYSVLATMNCTQKGCVAGQDPQIAS